MPVFFLEISGKHIAGFLVDGFDPAYPVAFAKRIVAAAGALYPAEVFGDKLIWAKPIFVHVGFTVDIMLREVATAYHAPVITAYSAPNKLDTVLANGLSSAGSKPL